MCGIVGFLTEELWNRRDRNRFVTQALIADTLRGTDATGAFFVPLKEVHDHPGWCKEVTDGYSFVTKNEYFSKYIEAQHYAVIGHNRAATIGTGIDASHPFQEGPITLVHNGTLADTTCLPISQYKAEAANDSHTIAINLAKHTVDEVIPKLDGSFALVWHDQRDGKMRIIRNSRRPLHLAKLKHEDTVLIASEAGMLMWLATRLKLDVEAIYQPDPMVLMEFDPGKLSFTTRKFEEYVSPKPEWPSWTGGYNNFGYGYSLAPRSSTPVPPTIGAARSTVTALGREMEVPEYLQEELFELELMPESRLVFTPMQVLGSREAGNTQGVCVVGSLDEENESAVLFGVPEVVVKHNYDKRWVVRPIGVKHLSGEKLLVVCKMVSADAAGTYGQSQLALGTTWYDDEEDPGPADLTEYLLKTQGGCIGCSRALCGDDMDGTIFVNGGRDPLCPECVEDQTVRCTG